VIGIVTFMSFWIASLVNAGFDVNDGRIREKNDRKALRAHRLLEKFEVNGNGRFRETDHSGTLLYLSPRHVEALGRPDGELIGDIEGGTDILIEVIEGRMFKSTVCWSD